MKATESTTPFRTLLPILTVNFINTLSYSVIIPFLIILVTKFGGNAIIYGLIGATYSAFQLVGAPVLGNWSDKFGRKRILILSQIGTFLAWGLFIIALLIPQQNISEINSNYLGAFTLTIPLLLIFLARAFDGLTGGNISVANAYLADISGEQNRKANFGKMAAAANLGFIFGPIIAGVLGKTALEELLPVIVAAFTSLLAIFVISFSLKESTPKVLEEPAGEGHVRRVMGQEHSDCQKIECKAKRLSFFEVLRLPQVGYLLFLYFGIFLSANFFYVSFPVHAIESMGWNAVELGIFFSILGAVLVIVEGPILTWLNDKINETTLVIVGNIILACGFFCFQIEGFWSYLGAILFGIGNGLMWPSFLSILSISASKKYQGIVQGYAGSVGSAASIIGLISGGFLYRLIGVQTFLISAIGSLFIAALCLKLWKESKEEVG